MSILKIVLTVLFVIICIVLTVIVLLQEGKSAGLGAISGVADTYWGKNKGRSMEGALEKATKYLVIAFLVVSAVLNIPFSKASTEDSAKNTTQTTETDDTSSEDTTEDASGDSSDNAEAGENTDANAGDTESQDGENAQ